MEATVYILECADGSYYTGLTKQDIEARVWEHNEGVYKGYTSKRLPVTLVFMEIYERLTDAINREQQIKGWNRKKKQALIAMNYEALPELSKNRQNNYHPMFRQAQHEGFTLSPSYTLSLPKIFPAKIPYFSSPEPAEGSPSKGEVNALMLSKDR